MAKKAKTKTKTPAQLEAYRAKRDASKTPEPSGDSPAAGGDGNRFVVHEHHARRLHWDLRLEHNGVLLSFALPRGVPEDPDENRLAVHTEDHPIEYLDFHGTIPKGEYGAGRMTIWDRGTYEAEKIEDRKIVATFHGERVHGRYALFQTRGDDWMIHRMDPAPAGREPLPTRIEPMKATLAKLPDDDEGWAYEIKWDGVRAIAYCEPGHLRLESRNLRDITKQYPEINAITRALGSRTVILDGELVAYDDDGRPSFQRLQRRMHVGSESEVRRRAGETPVTYVIFDILYADGETLFSLPYEERRTRLEELELAGEHWQVPAYHRGDGAALQAASKQQGLEGIIAKRLDSPYRPGKRSREWLKVKNVREQEVVVGGWLPGKGRREGELGALLVGYYDDGELRYAGKVGTGFDARSLTLLRKSLAPLARDDSPFNGRQPEKGSQFVDPKLVAQVEFAEWTNAGTLRHPSYKGLRDDKPATDVIREEPA
ncbi:MAG TPA: non-homologous end-joining DNA ligase [Solirubrobacterales bacterium]|nr:non-homologous end-joining DNA ligase [Solirubrobacterales bacterium]